MPPQQQTPPEQQRPAPTVDDLIARANAEVYAFKQSGQTEKRSPKQWFMDLTKKQKALLLTGCLLGVSLVVVIGMISPGQKSGSSIASVNHAIAATDTNDDGVIDDNDAATDTNGDGVIDSEDASNDTNGDGAIDENDSSESEDTNGDGVIDSNDTSTHTTDADVSSWWSNLFDKAGSAIEGASSDETEDTAETADAADTTADTSTVNSDGELDEAISDTEVDEEETKDEQDNAAATTSPQISEAIAKKTVVVVPTLSKVKNFRDAAASTTLMKRGVLYRSGKLQNATKSDGDKLAATLKNGAIIDLRTKKMRTKYPDVTIAGVSNTNFPVIAASSANGYVKKFVNNAADRKQFGAAITKIANTKGNVLIHCTAGKDRTGWTVAMVMYALGANDKQVMAEYLKSNQAGAKVDSAWLKKGITQAKKKNGGSIMNYIKSKKSGLGVSDDTIKKLKAKLKAS